MRRAVYILLLAFSCFAALAGGCTLVVDFDRSLLLDAGVDPDGDAGQESTLDDEKNAEIDSPLSPDAGSASKPR